MRALAPTLLLPLLAGTAAAKRVDPLVVGVEVNGHIPGTVGSIDRGTGSIDLLDLGPFAHDLAVSVGIGLPDLASEVLLRLGYGFASGSLPDGSAIGSAEATGYSLSAVPIALGWRLLLAPWRVRFLAGVDLGGQVARMRYDSPDRAFVGGDWSWCFGGRALAGIHVDVWAGLGVRLYVEGRLSQRLPVSAGPGVGLSLFGFGLAVVWARENRVASPPVAPIDPVAEVDGNGSMFWPKGDAAPSQIERASALIRAADAAKAHRDFIAAEELYRDGVRQLPRDRETRQNLEVPVRVDWAKVLIEVGRSGDARRVLEEALEINSEDPDARALLERLGGSAHPP